MKRVAILAALALMLFPASSNGDDLLLEWSGYLQEGALQEAVKLHLEERGIRPTVLRGGIKYTSKIKTPQRDYLFCNGRLASMVEGERVTGERFNYWMSALLATQKKIWRSHSRQVRTYLEADHVPVETAGGHYAVPPSQGSATRHHYLVSGACSRTVKPFVQITYTGFVKNAGTRSLLACPTTRPPCQAINRLTTRACSSKARGTTSLNGLESVFVARC